MQPRAAHEARVLTHGLTSVPVGMTHLQCLTSRARRRTVGIRKLRQSCLAVVPGSRAWQPCPAAVLSSRA